MIKFFRKIRQNLLMENRTGKYFKYALGEIVLVVIGILIALQINNLNEERKDRIVEQEILKQLKEEYQSNLRQLESKIAMRKIIIEGANKALHYLDHPDFAHRDTLMMSIGILTNTPTFDPISNDVINSGNIRLISNKDLKKRLTQWSTDVIQLDEIETEFEGNYRNILLPHIIKTGISREVDNAYWQVEENLNYLIDKNDKGDVPGSGTSLNPVPLEHILADKELEGLLSNAVYINYIANIESVSLRKRIIEIIDLLDTEIK